MSVYSGFPTRKLEEAYNLCLYRVIQLMGVRLAGTQFDQYFVTEFSSLYANIKLLEHHKYLQPKFSFAFLTLKESIDKVKINFNSKPPTRKIRKKKKMQLQQSVDGLVDNSIGENKKRISLKSLRSQSIQPEPKLKAKTEVSTTALEDDKSNQIRQSPYKNNQDCFKLLPLKENDEYTQYAQPILRYNIQRSTKIPYLS